LCAVTSSIGESDSVSGEASGGLATAVDWERYFSSFCGGLGNFFAMDWETF
jgi:hypothetical protein